MEYMHRGSVPPAPYMPMPRYLLGMPISSTAKILYTVLLSRALLSAQNDGWTDAQGRVYQYYTIEDLGKTLGKGRSAVKDALATLEKCGLICRQRQGQAMANRIYVKLPRPESQPSDSRKTNHQTAGKPTGNKKNYIMMKSNDTDQTGGYETL